MQKQIIKAEKQDNQKLNGHSSKLNQTQSFSLPNLKTTQNNVNYQPPAQPPQQQQYVQPQPQQILLSPQSKANLVSFKQLT